jgi:hypothetical protein
MVPGNDSSNGMYLLQYFIFIMQLLQHFTGLADSYR